MPASAEYNMNIKLRARYALTIIFAFAVAGCGGGSSGGGAAGVASTGVNDDNGSGTNPVRAQAAAARVTAFATPVEGSVTQSSTVSDSSGVTLDQVETTATYNGDDLRVSVTNRRAGSWGTAGTDDVLPDDEFSRSNDLVGVNTGNDYRRRRFRKRDDSVGTVFVDVLTNRLSAEQTDYLAGGVWLFVPRDVAAFDDIVIGAFADSSIAPTPASYLQTTATATYTGDATGFYAGVGVPEAYGGAPFIHKFVADASLTAAFGASPTIRGSITNLGNFANINGRSVFFRVAGDPTLNLLTTPIGNTAGGFFTGDTGGTHRIGGTTYNHAGKWGGQFVGDQAQSAVGTFGTTSGNADGYELTFVGAYGAFKD